MGYYSRLSGAIEFDPPANYKTINNINEALKGTYGCVKLDVHKREEPCLEGVFTRYTAASIIPTSDDKRKVYDLKGELKAIMALLPGRTWSGYLLRKGEDSGDIDRTSIINGKVVVQKAKFTFDDD